MAERTPTIRTPGSELVTPPAAGVSGDRIHVLIGSIRISWAGLLNGDTGKGVQIGNYPFKNIHFRGTFGAGGTILAEGSNDSTTGSDGNWFALTDPQGNAISKTAEAIEGIEEHPLWIRPHVTAGDGTTNLTAELVGNKE